MSNEPKTTRYQIVSSMTPSELLSEGYANYDDFYDPCAEERKKEAAIDEEETRKNAKPQEYYDKYYTEF
ncbi:MAG: hypothetical protein HC836_39810 [Richelia sp. RM2_1_2]|nr:hypothetical protein [Richelia sp. SM2_1_7]NJM19745.1 hypothetical protein [Richelia sp. SM1_7_0]NJN11735.1 hypothetical protein [Richelia sp. RM1_1_1]NJO30959.1 hypothetical protein [Richelia sp. SL_2_1]NJO64109.1 hypothetical protein [Richelia sp. RM2_1_2]